MKSIFFKRFPTLYLKWYKERFYGIVSLTFSSTCENRGKILNELDQRTLVILERAPEVVSFKKWDEWLFWRLKLVKLMAGAHKIASWPKIKPYKGFHAHPEWFRITWKMVIFSAEFILDGYLNLYLSKW